MKKTGLDLPRRFLLEIGFVEACQHPLNETTARVLPGLRSALGLCDPIEPITTLDELNKRLSSYEPQRWVGYYVDQKAQRAMVCDGLFHIPLPLSGVFEQALADLRRLNFADYGARPLPIIGGLEPCMPEPAHILLHDTFRRTTFLEPFEAGLLFLADERRNNCGDQKETDQ